MRHLKPLLSTSLPLLLAAGFMAPVWAPQAAQADSRLSTLAATTGGSAAFVVADRDQDQRRNDPEQRDRDHGRDEHHHAWVPGHWDGGILGLGIARHWVPGHYEDR